MADGPTERVLVPPLREELLTDAAKRLMWVAWLVAGVAGIGVVATTIELATASVRADTWIRFGTAVWLLALSSVVAYGMRRTKLRAEQMRLAGTAFLLVLAVSSGLLRHQVNEGELSVGMVSGIAVAIMLFPVLVPGTPRRAVLNGLLATATDIGVYAVLVMLEVRAPADTAQLFGLFRGDFIAIGIAYGIAHIVGSLEDRVIEARQLGAYTLHEKIGEGGMGEVWTASHALLRRPAAIKIIGEDAFARVDPMARDKMIQRFEREAQATAALRSPHTIDIYDFGVAKDETLYFVMELLEGEDVESLVARVGPLPPARAVHLLRQVCLSLAEAHAAGMVHRDVKPANVFVCRYGREVDFVKVLDFGLVRIGAPDEAALTMVGSITGTPAFMAPEQAVDGHGVDARADIFAVAALGCFMLSGRALFGHKPPAAYLAALKTQHAPPISELGINVPPELEDLLQICLAKNREDRPSDMGVVEARLAEVAATLPRWPPAQA